MSEQARLQADTAPGRPADRHQPRDQPQLNRAPSTRAGALVAQRLIAADAAEFFAARNDGGGQRVERRRDGERASEQHQMTDVGERPAEPVRPSPAPAAAAAAAAAAPSAAERQRQAELLRAASLFFSPPSSPSPPPQSSRRPPPSHPAAAAAAGGGGYVGRHGVRREHFAEVDKKSLDVLEAADSELEDKEMLCCPISMEIFRQPVSIPSGNTCEYTAIVNYIRQSRRRREGPLSPTTRKSISEGDLRSNRFAVSAIEAMARQVVREQDLRAQLIRRDAGKSRLPPPPPAAAAAAAAPATVGGAAFSGAGEQESSSSYGMGKRSGSPLPRDGQKRPRREGEEEREGEGDGEGDR